MRNALISFIFLITLFSCSKETDPLVGRWQTLAPLSPKITYTLNEDGSFCQESAAYPLDCGFRWESSGSMIWISGDNNLEDRTWTVRFLGANTMQVYARIDDSPLIQTFIIERLP